MQNKDNIHLKGVVEVERYDQSGSLLDSFVHNNRVVLYGRNYFVSRIVGTSNEVIKYIKFGGSGGSTQIDDTDLELPYDLNPEFPDVQTKELGFVTASSSTISTGIIIQGDELNGLELQEAGLFTDQFNMVSRINFASENYFTKIEGEIIKLTWRITLG